VLPRTASAPEGKKGVRGKKPQVSFPWESDNCDQPGPSEPTNATALRRRTHLRTGGSQRGFQIVRECGPRGIVGEARPRRRELRAAGADRHAQGAATDARTVGEDIPEFHRASRREVLVAFQEDSEYEHRESCHNASAPIPESDHRQRRQGQESAAVLHLVPGVELATMTGLAAGSRESITMQQMSTPRRDRIRVRRVRPEAFRPATGSRVVVLRVRFQLVTEGARFQFPAEDMLQRVATGGVVTPLTRSGMTLEVLRRSSETRKRLAGELGRAGGAGGNCTRGLRGGYGTSRRKLFRSAQPAHALAPQEYRR
jgi:hypothetical protein